MEKTVLLPAEQFVNQISANRRERVRIMPLGSDRASRGGGAQLDPADSVRFRTKFSLGRYGLVIC